jgi:hypothetical protein
MILDFSGVNWKQQETFLISVIAVSSLSTVLPRSSSFTDLKIN